MKVKPVVRKVYGRVEGVRVRLSLDEDDRPVSASVLDDVGVRGSDRDLAVKLAAKLAFEAATQEAQRTKQKRDNATAWKRSAETRAKDSAQHQAIKWLELAHAERPFYGWSALMERARRLAMQGGIEPARRDEISEHRTKRFLKRQRNASG